MKLNAYYGKEFEARRIDFESIKFVPVVNVPDDMPERIAEGIRSYNRHNLSNGVIGEKCEYAGKLNWILPDGVELEMPEYYLNYYVSSCEVYSNGGINAYCRMISDNSLIGYIIVR